MTQYNTIWHNITQYNTEDIAAHLSELEAYTLRTTAVHIRGPGQLSRYSDSLRAGRSGDPIPVGARFSAPVQTGPGAYPASYTMGTGSFPIAKRPGRDVDHPTPSSVQVEERVELYLYSPSEPSWLVIGWTLPLPLPIVHIINQFFNPYSATWHTECRDMMRNTLKIKSAK